MAESVVVDIDATFLKRVQSAQKSLSDSVREANRMTRAFVNMTQKAGSLASKIDIIQEAVRKMDLKTGVKGLEDMAQNAGKGITSLSIMRANIRGIQTEFKSFKEAAGKGFGMQITNQKDLRNIDKLNAAIKTLRSELNSTGKEGSLGYSDETIQKKTNELNIYKKAKKELTKTDAERVREQEALVKKSLSLIDRQIAKIQKLAKAQEKANNQIIKASERYLAADERKERKAEQEREKRLAKEQRDREKREANTMKESIRSGISNTFSSPEAAIGIASTSKSVNELKQSLKELEKAKNNINPDTKEGRKQIKALNKTIAETEKKLEKAKKAVSVPIDFKAIEKGISNASFEQLNKIKGELDKLRGGLDISKPKDRANLETINKLLGEINNKKVQDALESARSARSIDEYRRAISKIKDARANINPDTRDGRRQMRELNRELSRCQQQMSRLQNESERVKNGFGSLRSASDKLGQTINRAFGLEAIRSFTNELLKTYGAAEKTRKALGVLLGTEERASLMYNKITRLATKSPFTIQQLADATKQMAAYRVESTVLYEKTKMLADISAGLGVEMSRLILAYGQVKAATYLRATELRQFSEAGIDMLNQLSTYFTELEGRTVSAADVFDRISKRMVMFEDVDAVLTRVTSRGGAFYKMQEEMATTVSGEISNLKDKIQVALDDIGKSNHDTIMSVIKISKFLVSNLSTILNIVGKIAAAWIVFKVGKAIFSGLRTTVVLTTKAWKGLYSAVGTVMNIFKGLSLSSLGVAGSIRAAARAVWSLQSALTLGAAAAIMFAAEFAISEVFGSMTNSVEGVADAIYEADDAQQEFMNTLNDLAKTYKAEAAAQERYLSTIYATTGAINELNKADNTSIDKQEELNRLLEARGVALSELSQIAKEDATTIAALLSGDIEDLESAIDDLNKRAFGRAATAKAVLDSGIDIGEVNKALEASSKMVLNYYNKGGLDASRFETAAIAETSFVKAIAGSADKQEAITKQYGIYLQTLEYLTAELEKFGGYGVYDGDFVGATAVRKGRVWTNPTVQEEVIKPIYIYMTDKGYITNDMLGVGSYEELVSKAINTASAKHAETGARQNATAWIVQLLIDAMKQHEEATWFEAYNQLTTSESESTALNSFLNTVTDNYRANYADLLEKMKSSDDMVKKEAQYKLQVDINTEISQYGLDAEYLPTMKDEIAKVLGFKWDHTMAAPMTTWQYKANEYMATILAKYGANIEDLDVSLGDITRGTQQYDVKKEEVENVIKKNKEIIKIYEDIGDQSQYTEADYTKAKLELDIAKEYGRFYGITDKENKKSADALLKSITDVHKSYLSLKADMDDPEALTGAWAKFGDSLGLALKDFDISIDAFKTSVGNLDTEESVIAALEFVRDKFEKSSDEYYKIQREIDKIEWETKIKNAQDARKKITDELDKVFAGYELSIEFDKLHIPTDFAKDFFNIDVTDIYGLRKAVVDKRDELVGEKGVEEYKKYLNKVDELERKHQEDSLKKYAEFVRSATGERAKVLLDTFYEVQDIQKTFKITNTLAENKGLITTSQKEALDNTGQSISDLIATSEGRNVLKNLGIDDKGLAKIDAFNEKLVEQGKIVQDEAIRRRDDNLMKLDWDAFKASEGFTALFNDLDGASEKTIAVMIDKLEMYKDEWKDMPMTEMKQILDYLDKLQDAAIKLKAPKGQISVAKETMANLSKSGISDVNAANEAITSGSERISQLRTELSLIEQIDVIKAGGKNDDEITSFLLENQLATEEQINAIKGRTKSDLEGEIQDAEELVKNGKEYLSAVKDISNAYAEQLDRINKFKELADKTLSIWNNISELFDDDSIGRALNDIVGSMSNAVFESMSLVNAINTAKIGLEAGGTAAEVFGYKMNMALGVVGLIATGVQLVVKMFTFAIDQHDKRLQESIDAQADKIETLKIRYDELSEAIEDSVSAFDVGTMTKESIANLEAQKAATEEMISLEKDKKKSDEDAIDGWKEEIRELDAQIEEAKNTMFSKLTDGVVDDVLSATRSFVDAWHDAFKETGNGLKGLETSFEDMISNIIKQQATMTILGPFITELKTKLGSYINSEDTTFDVSEAAELKSWFDDHKDAMNESLRLYLEAFDGVVPGVGELSELEKGIQGMTEDQAEVLAAYWNSCRFTLFNIDRSVSSIASSKLMIDTIDNPIIFELKAQTTLLNDIKSMLKGVIGSGAKSIHTGTYLKVLA